MHNNLQTRDAKRIVHDVHHLLVHIQGQDLPRIAKALAMRYLVPQKAMLKAMARCARIHHTN